MSEGQLTTELVIRRFASFLTGLVLGSIWLGMLVIAWLLFVATIEPLKIISLILALFVVIAAPYLSGLAAEATAKRLAAGEIAFASGVAIPIAIGCMVFLFILPCVTIAALSVSAFPLFKISLDAGQRGLDRVAARAKGQRCPICGYALTGLSQPGCPECGWRRKKATTA